MQKISYAEPFTIGQNMGTIPDLPRELWLKIFDLLPIYDLWTVSNTNHSYQNLCQNTRDWKFLQVVKKQTLREKWFRKIHEQLERDREEKLNFLRASPWWTPLDELLNQKQS